jgi:hypothetical protein
VTALLSDRGGLLRRLAGLSELEPTATARLALAEAEFRLAVLPGTAPAEAIERLRRAVRHDPYAAKAHLHLGRLLHTGGHRWAALAAYREAHRLAPGSRRPPLLMATALLDLDRPARAVAAELLTALAADDRERIAEAVGGFDELTEQGSARRAKRPPGRDALTGAAPPAWHALLVEQVARKAPSAPWIRDYLHADLDPPVAAAAGTVLIACGAPPEAVRGAPALAQREDHAATRVFAATLLLAEAPDAEGFVRLAAGLLSARMVPAEVVCALHYARWAADEDDVTAALRLLDGYPPDECFVELRLAVLSLHAERAWADERLAEAGVLWQEMARLAPERPEVAVNLAMLATRTRSSGYRPAWAAAAELFYVAAARAGDLRHRADERVALHRAHSMQSLRAAGSDQPDTTELRRWLADGDAVEVWLREWDRYYVNARLGFRSPAHVLAAGDDPEPARDCLLRQLGSALDATAPVEFVRLARERVARACAARPPDVHREVEQSAADALMDEALSRALLLRQLAGELSAAVAARHRELACAVLRHLFLLPLDALDRHCAERGVITTDERLIGLLDKTAAGVGAGWSGGTLGGTADVARMLADVEAATAAAPSSVGLAVPHARLLLWAGRGPQAYAVAVSALSRSSDPFTRDWLALIVDDVGEALAADTPDEERRLMAELPLSTPPRFAVVDRLWRRRDDASRAEAVRLLADGARGAVTDRQRTRLSRTIRSLPRADPYVRPLIEEAWQRFRREHDRGDLEHALLLAEARRFVPQAQRLREMLDRPTPGPTDVHG